MKALILSLALVAPALAMANPELAQRKNCINCHKMTEKFIGPAFSEVAAKYAKDKDAYKKLAKKIQEGGTGVWGQQVMPPNAVTPAEAETLAKWVLTIK